MHLRLLILFLIISIIPGLVSAADIENYIQVKGESSTIVKPDIAHCFFKVSGYGVNYEESGKIANEKLSQLNEALKSVLEETPKIDILKVENKPKGRGFDENYEKEMYIDIAKAMKGEIPTEATPAKQEMSTNIYVYFALDNFSNDRILKLMNYLAEKEIAFNKSSRFDFDFTTVFDFNKNAIYYGMTSAEKYLEKLAVEAFKRAESNAKIISEAVGKKMTGLINVTGCGDILEGPVSIPSNSNLTGKDLGPLSVDSERLPIRFSKDFGFRIE